MKHFVFLASSESHNYELEFSIDSVLEMRSFSLVERGKNPDTEYRKRSVLIGKDHPWSKKMEKALEHDSTHFDMLIFRMRLNERLSLHCVYMDDDDFSREDLEFMFNYKVETGEIIEFLKESKI